MYILLILVIQARLQDQILSREPVLADLVHSATAVGTASFYPRTKFAIPFRFVNIQHSHAFEVDFSDVMTNTPVPVNGGRLTIDKPSFEAQQAAARRYRIYPIIGAVVSFILAIRSRVQLRSFFDLF